MIRTFFAALLIALPSAALAQAKSCIVPDALPELRAEAPPPGQIRKVPVTGYLLSLSWSPQYCRNKQSSAADASQCGKDARFGFILHGLWPEGDRQVDPAWCGEAKPLDAALIKQHFCMTPSARLLQHEWAKHGTCMADKPDRYFRAASILYRAVRFPDMNALSRRGVTVGAFAAEFARINRGMSPAMVRIMTTPGNWLKEVRICMDTAFKPRPCPKGEPTAPPKRRLNIWRDER